MACRDGCISGHPAISVLDFISLGKEQTYNKKFYPGKQAS